MTMPAQASSYAFARGEEVVARLIGVAPYHLHGGGPLSAACTPPWTIGRILVARRRHRRPAYLLQFRHDDCECLCWVDESAIDGTC